MKKKIMIVDDEQSVLEIVKAIFENEEFEVITAESGQNCLNKLETIKPDLILMDMMMPGITGRETTKKIRDNPKTKNIKIMFVSVARLSEVGLNELKELNVLDYVTKPFDNNDLVRRVKKILND